MTVLLIVLGGLAVWSLLALPVAVAIGRAFQAGEEEIAPPLATPPITLGPAALEA